MIWRFTLSNAKKGTLVLSDDDEPIGWSEIVLNVKRDMNWHGLFFEYAINLSFYGEGFDYLKSIYNTLGIDEYVELLVEEKCSDTDEFEEFYTGKLLLGKLEFDCTDDCICSCPIDPSGCLMQFKNRIDQPVDLKANIDFNNDALTAYNKLPFNIVLEPKAIVLRELAPVVNNSAIGEYDTPTQSIAPGVGSQHVDFSDYMIIPTGTVTLNELSANEVVSSSMGNTTGAIPLLMIAPLTGNYNVDINIPTLDFAAISVGSNPATSFLLVGTFYITVNGSVVYSDTVITTSVQGRHVINSLHWNQDITMSESNVLKAFIAFDVAADYDRDLISSYNVFIKYNDNNTLTPLPYSGQIYSNINIKAMILNSATNCNVFAINEALSRTVEAITNDCMRVKSDYFGRTDSQPYASDADGCGALEVITKGLLIRNFPLNKTVMAVSFKQLFDSLNSIHNIGIGLEPDTSGRTDLICTTFGGPGWTVSGGHHVYFDNYFSDYVSTTIEITVTTFVDNFYVYFGTAAVYTVTSGGTHTITGVPVGNLKLDIIVFDTIIGTICKHTGITEFSWIRIEPMEYFYSSTVLLTLDNVPSIKKKVMAEWYVSLIEHGYDRWETENSMGLDEFCTKRSYRTTLKEIQHEISNICKFIASGYSIEVAREKQYTAESTTDFRYDNDTFIICVRRDGGNLVVEQGIDCANTSTMTDIIDPDTIYNYRISPIRNFLRWTKAYMANYFADINNTAAKFTFTNGNGNFLVKGELTTGCILESGLIKENDSVSGASFANANDAKPLFKYELDEFDFPLSLSDYKIVKNNPRGTIQYRNKETDSYLEGYIYNIQYDPNKGIATFNILPKYQ